MNQIEKQCRIASDDRDVILHCFLLQFGNDQKVMILGSAVNE